MSIKLLLLKLCVAKLNNGAIHKSRTDKMLRSKYQFMDGNPTILYDNWSQVDGQCFHHSLWLQVNITSPSKVRVLFSMKYSRLITNQAVLVCFSECMFC